MSVYEFIRLYQLRASNMMWFLGAGASSAAGIPTAYDMIWDFKRVLYCSTKRIPLSACPDLGDPYLRERLQQYFDSFEECPSENSSEEYAYYFELAYPSENDRRNYIDNLISGAKPSYGHYILGGVNETRKS